MLLLTNVNADNTYSVKDTTTDSTTHLTKAALNSMTVPIVGVFRGNNGAITEIHTVTPKVVSAPLDKVVDMIYTPQYKEFAKCCQRIIPSYFFEVAASSSGKYHPKCNLGTGGLCRHTLFVCENLYNITRLESTMQVFQLTIREIDLMLIACMMHDFLKQGWHHELKDYSQHPNNAAKAIRGMMYFLSVPDLEFIARCIETHMGQWNTDRGGNVITRKPQTKYEWLVHLADYLGSRPNICMEFPDVVTAPPEKVSKYGVETPNRKQVKQGKTKLTPATLEKVQEVCMAVKDNPAVIELDKAILEKFGIERTVWDILDIWDGLLKYKQASEKQMKYVELAKYMYKNVK